jgi:hypothetical protein
MRVICSFKMLDIVMLCEQTHESRTTVSGENGVSTTTETFTNMQETDLPDFNKRWQAEQMPQLFSPEDNETRYRYAVAVLIFFLLCVSSIPKFV